MGDLRVKKLAQLLVNYSLKLKKGELLSINTSDIAHPLVKEVYREAIEVGAHPDLNIELEGLKEILLKNGSDEQLKHLSPKEDMVYRNYDAVLTIWGGYNTKPLSNVDSKKIALNRLARKDAVNVFFQRVAEGKAKWCGTQFPTHSDAQEAGMSLEEYEDFVYGAGLLNSENPSQEWEKISAFQQKIADFMQTKKTLRFVAKDTDLTLSVDGRKWINCDGHENFPDGEVFTTPIRESANGTVRFSFPAIYSGKEVEDVRLTFKDGKVIEATAGKGEEFLNAILDTDEGARYLGEIAVGTNYGVQNFTKNILFDEKIGGTFHLAVGAGFPETGGDNDSAIHWDMICDLRDGGKIYADDELIYENGKTLF
ncbi:aminopeptidase [bacterium]|nr:aminopeptidase [bacterium]